MLQQYTQFPENANNIQTKSNENANYYGSPRKHSSPHCTTYFLILIKSSNQICLKPTSFLFSSSFSLRYSFLERTWLQLPGAAHRSTTRLTPAIAEFSQPFQKILQDLIWLLEQLEDLMFQCAKICIIQAKLLLKGRHLRTKDSRRPAQVLL